jgi:hypothetical protein
VDAKTAVRRGDVWTWGKQSTYDQCEACGNEMHGEVLFGEQIEMKPTETVFKVLSLRFKNMLAGKEVPVEPIVLLGVREAGF